MLTISSGYDPGYLTRAVATGRENYYLSAVAHHGEPPGIWTGLGCPELGLQIGSRVDPAVMQKLYGAFLDPRDPGGQATLGRAPSRFAGHDDAVSALIAARLAAEPDATGERRNQIILQALQERRSAVYFFDATFSVPKSVSLLHAALQVRAQQAEEAGQAEEAQQWAVRAQMVWDGIWAGNQAMLAYLQREAGYSRAGYHSKDSGRFADAHEWVIASFGQHTSRDNDPQLHIHNAMLNRVLRDDPLAARPADRLAWRTLDGAALYLVKPAAAAIAERTLAEYLSDRLGVQAAARPDGYGWEITGISEALRDQFSSRRRAIEPGVQELVDAYQRRHGRAPDARALWSMAQFVTLDSRQAKARTAPSRESLLARWEAQSRRAETEALSAVPAAVLNRRDRDAVSVVPAGAQIDMVLAAAVADAQQNKATFSRYELTRMINRHLPDYLGGLSGEQVTGLLDDLTDQALRPGGPCEVLLLTAPEMVPVPQIYRRADGLSLWHRHGAQIYTTRTMLDLEARLLRAATQIGAPHIAPDRAAVALGAEQARLEAALWREHHPPGAADAPGGAAEAPGGVEPPLSSAGLTDDQAMAAYGVLTSGRAIDILIGPAGTGKTRTVARIATAWQDAGTGRVIGLTTSTNAAHLLAAEGITHSCNLARFLGRIPGSDQTRGHMPVLPGDLLVIDEASMVPTTDLAAVEQIATRCRAKILLTGDTGQLSVHQAGGVMKLLAGEHGYYQLRTVQRFEHAWERDASLYLRAGDAGALTEYDQHGRLLGGTREQMTDVAHQRWLADHLSGKTSVLLATSNAQATELARRARDQLAALHLVANSDLAELRDGNMAGIGDLIVARQNDLIEAGEDGRMLANRDVLRIDLWDETGTERIAWVRRITGRDPATRVVRWSAPFELPASYIGQHTELAYAGSVHAGQGRTVDTGHLLIDQTAIREALYVGMSRGRQRNTAYVITEQPHTADLSPESRPAPQLQDPAASQDTSGLPARLAVLTVVLGREQDEQTATEAMRRELELVASLATLAPMWAEVTRTHAVRRYEAVIRSLLTGPQCQQYEHEPERGTLTRLLRTAELAGHDTSALLRTAIQARDFTGARSIAAVLHGRIRQITGTPEPQAVGSYLDRTPGIEDSEADRFARELATAMDQRIELLGLRTAADRPAWALHYLGQVPADPDRQADWIRRAGLAAAYREERGYAHDTDAIGPAPDRASPELRTSWHAAYVALQMPDHSREVGMATDGELLARRAAYARETAWAPPYVASELRDAHLAEDIYQADAIHAWHGATAAADATERAAARQEAAQLTALGREVGAHRAALTEIADARRQWHAATELTRLRALMADSELRRRHPNITLPPLHPGNGPDQATQTESGAEMDHHNRPDLPGTARLDLAAALDAARRAQRILAERQHQADHDVELVGDDLMRRREAEARQDAEARRSAVRQEPAPSRHLTSLERDELDRDELELEAGQ